MTDTMPNATSWPRVSIVTPSYNQEPFIEETIRSVLLQGYPDLEYIIIDGGSKDGSVDIIRKYAPWLSYWVSEPDRGQTHAINKGWARATGDLLAYINTDDYYLAGAVTRAVREFLAHPRAGMVYGAARIVDETGRELRIWEAQPFDLKTMLTAANIVPQPAAFFAGDVLKRVGCLNEKWQMILDYELCIRIGREYPAVSIPEVLAIFRDHSQSKTRTQFEAMARELIHFGTTFFATQTTLRNGRAIKRATMARYYYLLSLSFVAQERQRAFRASMPLLRSILQYPCFALKRPLQTAYIVKQVLLSHLSAIHERFAAWYRCRRENHPEV